MKASELEAKHQGPSDCEARCVELGMRMGALVLVSDTLPGCVCLPKTAVPPAPKPNTGGEAPTSEAAEQGASAATTSYVVAMAAAASARATQTQQQKQQQQSYLPK